MAFRDQTDNNSNRSNTQKHLFFLDEKKNSTLPSWFVECSRDDAENMLMRNRRDGNVLMRPSSDHQYALTVRTTGSSGPLSGTTKVSHYSVRRNKHNQFYVDIDIKHDPAPTLSEIFERFMDLAGTRHYQPFSPKSTDSGCLPEVNSWEASKLSERVLPLVLNPGSGSGSDNYADVRPKPAPRMNTIPRHPTAVTSTSVGDYLTPACSNDSTGEYLTTLPDDDDQDYLAICEDDKDVQPKRHASVPRPTRDADYTNLNQNVSKPPVSQKPPAPSRAQSMPVASGPPSRLQRPT